MKVIILAAGRGSRINSLSQSHPKCLTHFKGKTLLENTLENLSQFFNYQQIYLVAGYKYEMLKNYSSNVLVNRNWNSTNIMGSLCVAEKYLNEESCLVIYSDVYFDSPAVYSILNTTVPSVLNVVNWKNIWEKRFENPIDDLENFTVDSENYLTKIGGRPDSLDEIMGQFGGMFTLNPTTWGKIKNFGDELRLMDSTTCLNMLISHGERLKVADYDGFWAEIDREEDVNSQ